MQTQNVREKWLAALFSTQPADRARAESAVQALYRAAGSPEPQQFLWFDSPLEAARAVAEMHLPYSYALRLLSPKSAGSVSPLGSPIASRLCDPSMISMSLKMPVVSARMALHGGAAALFRAPSDKDDLFRAEQGMLSGTKGVLVTQPHWPSVQTVLGNSFFSEYSFAAMADDEAAAIGPPPPILEAAWNVARSAGLWWPFERGAVLTERPVEICRNEQLLLHRGDGPAVLYRDGARVYAWNGQSMREKWILSPETIPPGELKRMDPSFRKFLAGRTGAPSAVPKRRVQGVSAILSADLPTDHPARIARLREHAGGAMPFFDRYLSGDCRQVWSDLVALGPAVREDPHAAGALAVAYETMHRVESNVRLLVGRLEAFGYRFTEPDGRSRRRGDVPHEPPSPKAARLVRRLEKSAGAIPLSLRAFYETVGSVNLIGRHPSLAPEQGSTAPDPLVVYGIEDALAERDAYDDEPDFVSISPDDLHKSNVSGGDGYEISLPDLRADAELLNERHGLFFVDYLRLCFRFGGFPGYDGENAPPEIADLAIGLADF